MATPSVILAADLRQPFREVSRYPHSLVLAHTLVYYFGSHKLIIGFVA